MITFTKLVCLSLSLSLSIYLTHCLAWLADTHDTTRTVILYLDNIKTIIRHFSAKIDQWQEANTNSTLTQEQVVHIIRNNYESLKLNLMDALDLYEPFLENPHEVQFFRKYLRVLVSDYKALIEVQPVEIRVL